MVIDNRMSWQRAFLAMCLASVTACAATSDTAPRSSEPSAETAATAMRPPAASAGTSLERVTDSSQVCMVNDAYMGRPQIPVVVGGKTYYGCCAMCEQRLGNDVSARTASDPLTGERVDKATAIIGRTESDAVLYFASAENFERYAAERSR